ncbi:MAG: ABC transporter substrate-binding protein, partial [Oscillospiraceae bacterium]
EKYGEDPRIIEVPGGGVLCIGLGLTNEKNPILQNQKFRQALFFGTNRAEAAKLGNNIPSDYYVTQPYIVDIDTGLSFRDTPEAKTYIDEKNYNYNPEKAKSLLDEALKETGAKSATLEILYQDSSESRKKVCEYLQNAWQGLFGTDKLTITLQAVPSQQLSERYRSHKDDPNAFEAGVIQSTYNYLDPSSALMEWNK